MDNDTKGKFAAITARNYAGQAKWFLNGYWKEHEKDAEQIWEYVQLAIIIDHRRGKEGNELDELEAHRFLERLGETLTVKDMRQRLTDIDLDFNRRMALIEYLIFRYTKKVKEVANAHQGGEEMRKKVKAAEELVVLANNALDELSQRLEAEKQALAYERLAESNCRRAEAEALKAEDESRQSEAAAKVREQSALERESVAEQRAREAKAADDENKARALHPQEVHVRQAHHRTRGEVRRGHSSRRAIPSPPACAALITFRPFSCIFCISFPFSFLPCKGIV